nr:MAG TPA: hypothetical protein [Bacteriophage sp.]
MPADRLKPIDIHLHQSRHNILLWGNQLAIFFCYRKGSLSFTSIYFYIVQTISL